MRYRRIVDGEPQFGQSKKDFLQGIDAVAQAISTRLKLFTNEWWEDLEDGLPVWTQMLGIGQPDPDVLGLMVTERILNTQLGETYLVLNMMQVKNEFNGDTRKFSYNGIARSVYGPITVATET